MPPRKKQHTNNGDALLAAVAPRRTTRASAKAAQAGGIVAADTTVVVKTRGKAKRANSGAPKRVVRKGRLQSLPDLALEVQLEIYNYLDLEDIFNLSRTCKKFRAFFMDKTLEKKLWVPARENTADIPERPPWMGERGFAYLLYSPHCHNCGTSNIRKIVYGWFVRLCSACLQTRTVSHRDVVAETWDLDDGSILSRVFDVNALTSYFHVHEPSHLPYDKKVNRIFKDDVDRVFDLFFALPDSADKGTFSDQVKAEHKARLPYADGIENWMEERDWERLAHLDNTKQRRFNDILARLRDAGWGKDLDYMGPEELFTMRRMPVVRQSTKLTEGAWKKVLVVLDEFLHNTREKRLSSELRTALEARFKLLEEAIVAHYVSLPRSPRMDCRPQYIDLAFIPECRALTDLPTSKTVTADHFAAIVPALAQKWDADRKRELTAYLLPHLGDIAPDVDPLELAIACFTLGAHVSCFGSIRTMRYPAILKHRCCRGSDCFRTARVPAAAYFEDDLYTRATKTMDGGVEFEADIRERSYDHVTTRVPFRIGALDAHGGRARDVVSRMRRIVCAVGLDPARATIGDLERCDVWLRCVVCETQDPGDAIHARSWSSAYEHDRYHTESERCPTDRRGAPEWRHADDADMAKVRTLQEAESLKTRFGYLCQWSCALCPDFDADADAMATHLDETHAIADFCQARQDGVVFLHPFADPSKAFADSICLRERVNPHAAVGYGTPQ